MVLNRRIRDSSLLARPRFKIKQPLMETVSGSVPLSRKNKNAGKRWKLGGVGTSGTPAPALGTIVNAADAAAIVSNTATGKSNGMTVPSVTSAQQPTTHQKVRRILEEHAIWQERAHSERQSSRSRGLSNSSSTSSPSSGFPGNYNIVASRGELPRGSFSVRESAPLTANSSRKSRIEIDRNGLFVNARDSSRSRSHQQHSPSNWEKRAASRDYETSSWKNSRNCAIIADGTLPKSSSVPANLKSVSGSSGGLNGSGGNVRKVIGKNSANGILRKSSAFLASLTHSSAKKCNDRKGSSLEASEKEKPRFSLLKRNAQLVASLRDEDPHGLRRSPSCQNLSNTGKKKSSNRGVKKSVSFSSDTSFEEKRAPFCRKTAVHEAKVYRKGVLRDLNAIEKTTKKVPGTWDSPSGDPKALLRASREADDHDLKDLVSSIRRTGLGQMDVNATDSSGRTAISYMAGNGSPAMLEAILTFAGCDPNLPDNEGNTPLHFAAQAGQTECLNLLLQRCPGIEIDARNILGFTPLMKAALQGRTKCAKILLFAGANPTMRDHGRGLRAEQWARYCGRYVCADIIERFARHKLLEKNISCRWGSEPELATKVLQGKVVPVPINPIPPPSTGFRSKIKRVFRTTSGPDRSFSLVSQLTNAALCASTPALPKPGEPLPNVKSLVRPLSVPQLRVTLVGSQEIIDKAIDKCGTNFSEKFESSIEKPPRSKKKNK
ncbi:uncharacterized protein [Venturia canescens]|nr:uncharacterized protein LOC122417296 isoform X2 [Venturia canescens]XP_043286639.1 uncharacterized protein LOC122417296 isoform X2 [Venturia canescens]XP_043286640.1 uncharacterized protein LOC122417296 isoform X2 [Venturia canescens]XP_043286643.1 uncharacterized protein LOC122417296 isoform X2 [Venturia canescens]